MGSENKQQQKLNNEFIDNSTGVGQMVVAEMETWMMK